MEVDDGNGEDPESVTAVLRRGQTSRHWDPERLNALAKHGSLLVTNRASTKRCSKLFSFHFSL